ncbi:MAG TPA: bifunctional hydroxymethylpyrimidine kinase/phosphomethylpyrimidine kinase [Sandaracinaceae bacterium LLY-WYZ-13_1]|nr:bifunctional hydroxymethylpyrimidine kinase/phosphomethylpyrimidine kinase [Sandaracinaceae bacterium LLY-WYZ-13_1]
MTQVALTIAGSDPSGGAGIQADLKTFHQHGVYGTAAITLLTVQNTHGVRRVEAMPGELVAEQVAAVVEDVPPGAAKTGALGTREVIEAVASAAAGFAFPLVVDPVMVSKHGAPLVQKDAAQALRDLLMPHATLVTPNANEAEWMCGFPVTDRASAVEAARALAQLGPRAVLVKGGHVPGDEAVDVLLVDDEVHPLSAPRVDTKHTHGTGCTYAAAITARLALGETLVEAVSEAKGWLTEALRHPPRVGGGIGPVDHFTPITRHSVPPPAPGR